MPSSLTPKLRVLSSHPNHPYHRALYRPIRADVATFSVPDRWWDADFDGTRDLPRAEIFHMHWPEWFLHADLARHQAFIRRLHRQDIQIVWTQHNLLPHWGDSGSDLLYQLWADSADGVIHHSQWGQQRALAYRTYSPAAVHRVIPHGHWGARFQIDSGFDRDELARTLGLNPGNIRLGVFGAPRRSKKLDEVMEAFVTCDRDDLELLVYSLAPGEHAPTHPRLRAFPFERVDRVEFNRRLASVDALILPFDSDTDMLTTGFVGDVIGMGLPALISDWEFLLEVLGDAGIVYGSGMDDLRSSLQRLTRADLDHAAQSSRKLQQRFDWAASAEQTLTLLRELRA